MNVLITGAAGNLGSALARHLAGGPHTLRLMVHRKEPPEDLAAWPGVEVVHADLACPDTLPAACEGIDCIVHFAGVLFAPRPERFLPMTNVKWVDNLLAAALAARVGKFILVSFPHVEGETTPGRPATGRMDGEPSSAHARTRLEAERHMFAACEGTAMTPVALRPGMVYSRGVLMIDTAKWLVDRHLLAVWRGPTWIHLIALPDFNACVTSAIERPDASGVYNLGDEDRLTLQEFLDCAAAHWGHRPPPRLAAWCFFTAGAACELFAAFFRTRAPLTRDFVRIGMASYYSDTSRMRRELLPELEYRTLEGGMALL